MQPEIKQFEEKWVGQPETFDGRIDLVEAHHDVLEFIAYRDQIPQPEVLSLERRDNARTALMEALTASGHLSEIEIRGDSIEEIHDLVMARLLNGYSDDLPEPEKQRRFYELVNERAIHKLHQLIVKGEVSESTAFLEISDYAASMPDDLAQSLGYRAENKKGMVRSTSLVSHPEGGFSRLIEQVSRSNSGPETTGRFYEDTGWALRTDLPPDIAALANPVIYDLDQLTDGVIDIQRRLDSYIGPQIRYGEINNELHASYEDLRAESRAREAQIEYYIDRLANFEEHLDGLRNNGMITQAERDGQYAHEVVQMLRAICTLAPEYAHDTFGKKAAQYYEQAGYFELMGNYVQRDYWLARAEQVEKPITFCGVMISPEKAKELGVELSDVSELVETGKEKWVWKKGICRVSSCDTRPGKTLVGPCSVCRKCQVSFDSGKLK